MSTLPEDYDRGNPTSVTTAPEVAWRFMRSVDAAPSSGSGQEVHPTSTADQQPVVIPRVQLSSAEHFQKLLQAARPVIVEQSDIGPCTLNWTSEYLKEKVGSEREVIVQ